MRLPFALAVTYSANLAARVSCAPANSSTAAAAAFVVNSVGDSQRLHSRLHSSTTNSDPNGSSASYTMTDEQYPGTAVERMNNVRKRVAELAQGNDLNGSWPDVRRKILWAGGLKDLPNAVPGQGYTGHSFNDYNHVDLTCMVDHVSDSENSGKVQGIAMGNQLGEGIRVASLPELGPGGSWSTCITGCNKDPPQDVAHVQFKSRIAFKLVWVPNEEFDTFVLVDDDGKLLAQGKPRPISELPHIRERQMNYQVVQGSKYAREADKISKNVANE